MLHQKQLKGKRK